MKLTPTFDRVAIIREEKKKKSEGGILLPCEKESNFGTVVAVGPGAFNMDGSRREVSVKKGDMVFFKDDYHTMVADSKQVIVDDEDILAILK